MVAAPLKCLKMPGNVGEEPLAIPMVFNPVISFPVHFLCFLI